METKATIETPKKERDYFPSIFSNRDNSIIILADERTSDKTFSGMIVHSSGNNQKTVLGRYSTGWTYAQFTRLPKGSNIALTISQED